MGLRIKISGHPAQPFQGPMVYIAQCVVKLPMDRRFLWSPMKVSDESKCTHKPRFSRSVPRSKSWQISDLMLQVSFSDSAAESPDIGSMPI